MKTGSVLFALLMLVLSIISLSSCKDLTTKPKDVPKGFVYVPGGTFTMGDTRGEGESDELPTHSVTLDPFYMGKHLLTQAEYAAIMGSNPAHDYGEGDDYPVYYVSWYSALKYCNLRSMAEELSPCYTIDDSIDPADWGDVPTSSNSTWNAAICDFGANGYRLPTEAEWEYAARGTTNDPDYLYSGSNNIDAVAWYIDNTSPSLAPDYSSKPVGTKARNALGLYDMSGNVYEWCWDWYSSYSADAQNNPTGPASESSRVRRGGYYESAAIYCRVSFRAHNDPSSYFRGIGFRLCRRAKTQTVSTSTFNPLGETYVGAQNVTLSCASFEATIRYTTIGSEPT